MLSRILLVLIFSSSPLFAARPEDTLCARIVAGIGKYATEAERVDWVYSQIADMPASFTHGLKPKQTSWARMFITGTPMWAQIPHGHHYTLVEPSGALNVWKVLSPAERSILVRRLARTLAFAPGERASKKEDISIFDQWAILARYVEADESSESELAKKMFFGWDELVGEQVEIAIEYLDTLIARAERAGVVLETSPGDRFYSATLEGPNLFYSPLRLFWAAELESELPAGAPRAYILAGVLLSLGIPKNAIVLETPAPDLMAIRKPVPVWLKVLVESGQSPLIVYPSTLDIESYINWEQLPTNSIEAIQANPLIELSARPAFLVQDKIFPSVKGQEKRHREKMRRTQEIFPEKSKAIRIESEITLLLDIVEARAQGNSMGLDYTHQDLLEMWEEYSLRLGDIQPDQLGLGLGACKRMLQEIKETLDRLD